MALAIEPMIAMGHYEVYVTDDGWTVKMSDKAWAAHVEDTIVITHGDPKILTRPLDVNLGRKDSRSKKIFGSQAQPLGELG